MAHTGAPGGIDDVRQGLPGHTALVGQFFHAGAQCHDIQIVIHKNKNPHDPGDHHGGPWPPAELSKRPCKSQCSMGFSQQRNEAAEQRAHQKDPLVRIICRHAEKSIHPVGGDVRQCIHSLGRDPCSAGNHIGQQSSKDQRFQSPLCFQRKGNDEQDGDQCPYSIFHEYNLVSTTVAFIGVLLVPAKVIIEHFR